PRVEREQVAALYATLASATLADVLVAAVIAAIFYVQLGKASILAWLGLHLAQSLRYPLLGAYHRDPRAGQRSRHWTRVATRELSLNSAVWGLGAWMLLPGGDLVLASLLMLVILTLASAGTMSVAPVRSAVFAYTVPMTIGLASALVWDGRGLELFLAGCCVLYLAVTLHFALRQHRLLARSLVERFAKEELAEQLARQIEVSRRASEEKTRFLAAASHDLRQPLHAIALFGAVLERELRGGPQHANAGRLMRAVGSLGLSLDTMLDISRLDAGVLAPERRAVPLNQVFQSLQQLFAQRAEDKGLQLRLRASPLVVHTDPDMLQRMLANIVENAIKYTSEGGVLVVARRRGSRVWIDVMDTGMGIGATHLEHVFDEFYQVDNPGRDRSRGLGIGLSIVRRLSDLLAHPVTVLSRPGRGSRFRIEAPLAEGEVRDGGPLQQARPGMHSPDLPRRVLLVDDEADIGEAVAALLQSHGVAVWVARDETGAHAALADAHAAGQPFDALLCDYRLAGGADGLEAAMRLRAQPGRELPLLLVTGETSPERLQLVRESGVPVVFKPATAEVLIEALAGIHATAAVDSGTLAMAGASRSPT
ncbi:MAG: ATP-binding protein, partial [Steroidobacteraceae bacterium]|nr:ATP-binding protein [Steroidobacteraceae bacterium]